MVTTAKRYVINPRANSTWPILVSTRPLSHPIMVAPINTTMANSMAVARTTIGLRYAFMALTVAAACLADGGSLWFGGLGICLVPFLATNAMRQMCSLGRAPGPGQHE